MWSRGLLVIATMSEQFSLEISDDRVHMYALKSLKKSPQFLWIFWVTWIWISIWICSAKPQKSLEYEAEDSACYCDNVWAIFFGYIWWSCSWDMLWKASKVTWMWSRGVLVIATMSEQCLIRPHHQQPPLHCCCCKMKVNLCEGDILFWEKRRLAHQTHSDALKNKNGLFEFWT